jgi:hypothetical protein
LRVKGRIIVRAKRGGNAALRPFAGRARIAFTRRHDRDRTRAKFQRGEQTRQTGTDDKHITDINNIGL